MSDVRCSKQQFSRVTSFVLAFFTSTYLQDDTPSSGASSTAPAVQPSETDEHAAATTEPGVTPSTGSTKKGKQGSTSIHAGPADFVAGQHIPVAMQSLIATLTTDASAQSASSAPAVGTGLKVVCWNVNGLRAATKSDRVKDLQAYVAAEDPDVLCLQETKIDETTAAEFAALFPALPHAAFNCSQSKAGYAGVATYSKRPFLSVSKGMGIAEHDSEGRMLTVEMPGHVFIVNVYVPNSGMKLERLEYRTSSWDPAFRHFLTALKDGGQQTAAAGSSSGAGALPSPPSSSSPRSVIVVGDLNVAHHDMDVHAPKPNRNKTPGFCDGERDGLAALIQSGFRDVWRERHPNQQQFTYWSARFNCRANNKGWRLDYVLIAGPAADGVADVGVRAQFPSNDHVPVYLLLK